MLYEFATEYMRDDSPARGDVLQRAAKILAAEAHSRREFTLLMGDIYLALDRQEDSIEEYRLALISQPNDPKTRYKRAKLLVQTDRLEEALEEAEYLRRHDGQNSTYNKFFDDVESEITKRARD
jgi:predicted Zn-dependent protease